MEKARPAKTASLAKGLFILCGITSAWMEKAVRTDLMMP